MSKSPVVAIVGATGLVGSEMGVILSELAVPCDEVRLFASEDSVGEVYTVCGEEVEVQALDGGGSSADGAFAGVDIALFATSAELSSVHVPAALDAGAFVIDNSSFFRMQEGVPLVVPEVNIADVTAATKLIANPNCSTIQLAPVLAAVQRAAGLRRVVVATYQSVSGAGKAAMDELWSQTLSIFNQREIVSEEFSHQIAFNCIPQIDVLLEDGYSKEEAKIMNESRKILGLPDLKISATAVRVPVLCCHAEAVHIETEQALSPAALVEVLQDAPGIRVYSHLGDYPMQVVAAGSNEIHVGRIRRDHSFDNGLALWIVADNVRKGAALNAVQIAKHIIEKIM